MTEAETQVLPPVEEVEGEEVVLSELPGTDEEGTRTIRVYDKGRGDFTLEIPRACTITFGYFNPAAAGNQDQFGGGMGRGGTTMKTTCLRIYAGKTSKTPQLGAFLAVDGFRDLSLKLTRLRQRVVIESNFEDDGEGKIDHRHVQQKQLVSSIEDDEVPF